MITPVSPRAEGESRSQPRLSLPKKLAFSVVTCVLLFASVEGGARLIHGPGRHWLDCHRGHPELGWCLRENWSGRWSWTGGAAHINRQGIRADEDLAAKPPGERRLLILGDSVTFGARVKTAEAYPAQLEEHLRAAGINWRVLNGGVSAYDPSQEVDWLERFGWQLEPDCLAIAFCRNDLFPMRRSDPRNPVMSEVLQWTVEHSILAANFQRACWRLQARTVDPAEALREFNPPLVGWPFVEHSYRRLAELAAGRGLRVILLDFPTLAPTSDFAAFGPDDFSERLARLGDELGWPVIHIAPAWSDESSQFAWPGDLLHPNALGHERAAQRIAAEIVRRGVLRR